ncbi:serpin B9 [Galendromus occidentalis]|uniref:Serpin B9 n=1 Tax=Galendromus occidentalis TaxID=34638 RepID=A0AAJ6QME5_9ACAR|nr:serpin B9 [Galendromus occidentalis]
MDAFLNLWKKSSEHDFKYSLATSLLQKLCRDERKNFVISPLSLGTCLGMVLLGMKGKTRKELLDFMKASDENSLHSAFETLLSDDKSPFKIANKVLADKSCVIREESEASLKTKYKAEIDSVDFTRSAKEIEDQINTWVANKTNKRIPKLISENSLKPDHILVLLNAIYFKATWLHEFSPLREKENFKLRSGDVIKANFMMKSSSSFGYGESDSLRLAKIPYEEQNVYMVAAIPKDEEKHIDDVIAGMSISELASTIESVEQQPGTIVALTMPKFKIAYDFEDLPKNLKGLGVNKMFIRGECDLGNLFSKVKDEPFVSEIIHKAVIEVNEKTTEATAATLIGCRVGCAPNRGPPPRRIALRLDRPFCFWILSGDNVVPFVGICADPTS